MSIGPTPQASEPEPGRRVWEASLLTLQPSQGGRGAGSSVLELRATGMSCNWDSVLTGKCILRTYMSGRTRLTV